MAFSDYYDVAVIGGGPANLGFAALAKAIPNFNIVALEASKSTDWHPGMHIPGTNLQTNYLKDLVTMINPSSDLSILSFFTEHGLNYQAIVSNRYGVSRQLFEKYLKWASNKLPAIRFNERVSRVDFDMNKFIVTSTSGQWASRHLVVGTGKTPHIPDLQGTSKNGIHSSEYMSVFPNKNLSGKTVAVIGGGQSGAEIVEHLLSKRDIIKNIVWVTNRINMFPLDDSPFINEYYTPSFTIFFHGLDVKTRNWLNGQIRFSSDGASGATLENIYKQLFDITHIDDRKDFMKIYCGFELFAIDGASTKEQLHLRSCITGTEQCHTVDELVFATGYKFEMPDFLSQFNFEMSENVGVPKISSEFEATWDGPTASNKIFFQNTHASQLGLADSNLSFIPWRSATIINNIFGRNEISIVPETSAIDWSLHFSKNLKAENNE